MKYRTLGRTGIKVSEIGHGLWGMGDWSDADQNESLAALSLSESLGCNFFDSAWAYGDGLSDKLLGELIVKTNKPELVTAGKIPPKNLVWPSSPNDALEDTFPEDHVIEFTKRSLDAAGIDKFALMQYHVWDDSWAANPVFQRTVERLKSEGLCEGFGISLNRWEPWNGIKAIKTGLVDVVQVIYNIFDQAPEDELFPLCAENNIGVIARVPLDEGSLGGNMNIDTKFPESDWRSKYFGPENLPETINRIESLKKDLPLNSELSDIALRFILQNPVISTVIVGMRKKEHVMSNARASNDENLDPELMSLLKHHRWDRKGAPWAN